MKKQLTVGQTVWVKIANHRGGFSELQESVITEVGRKYFQIEGLRNEKVNIESLKAETRYGVGYSVVVYLNPKDYESEVRTKQLSRTIQQYVSSNLNRIPLEQLEQIATILNLK